MIALFREAIHWRNEYRRTGCVWTDDQLEVKRVAFDLRLLDLVSRPSLVPEYGFVFNPSIEPTNWQAEQAIRPAVVNRKVWGDSRTWVGARSQSVLMSVLETCRRQSRSVLDHVSQTLRAFGNHLLPRPQILLGR